MFCTNCGKQIDDRAGFCQYCGKQIKTAVSPPIEPKKPTVLVPPSRKPWKVALIAGIAVAVVLLMCLGGFFGVRYYLSHRKEQIRALESMYVTSDVEEVGSKSCQVTYDAESKSIKVDDSIVFGGIWTPEDCYAGKSGGCNAVFYMNYYCSDIFDDITLQTAPPATFDLFYYWANNPLFRDGWVEKIIASDSNTSASFFAEDGKLLRMEETEEGMETTGFVQYSYNREDQLVAISLMTGEWNMNCEYEYDNQGRIYHTVFTAENRYDYSSFWSYNEQSQVEEIVYYNGREAYPSNEIYSIRYSYDGRRIAAASIESPWIEEQFNFQLDYGENNESIDLNYKITEKGDSYGQLLRNTYTDWERPRKHR